MRVLVCPDKFAGTLSAGEAAQAVAEGWSRAAPSDEVRTLALSDGGPGFLSSLATGLPDARSALFDATDTLGRPVRAGVLLQGDVAYLESAQTCGLHLLTDLDPASATSYGLGQALTFVVELGVREVVVGLGGTATNDGGAGMLAALGAAPLDAAGYALGYGVLPLLACASLSGVPRLRQVGLVAATDVDNPLTGPTGASYVFGPQKGASAAQLPLFDAALSRFAVVLSRCLPTCPPSLATLPGAGAAGGLGAALLACGARRESGFDVVARSVGLSDALDWCDLVITGEGCVDRQSLRGKVVGGVAAAAQERGLPCVVLAGRLGVDGDEPSEWRTGTPVHSVHTLVGYLGDLDSAMSRAAEGLRELAEHLAPQYHLPRSPSSRSAWS